MNALLRLVAVSGVVLVGGFILAEGARLLETKYSHPKYPMFRVLTDAQKIGNSDVYTYRIREAATNIDYWMFVTYKGGVFVMEMRR